MRRRPSNLVAAVSLCLFVATAALWVRSHMVPTILVGSRPGQVVVVGVDASAKSVHERRDGAPSLDDFLDGLAFYNPPREQHLLGFYLARGGSGIRTTPGDVYQLEYFWVVGIPYWSLALLTLAPVVWWAWRRRVASRRVRANACAHCGYDLRATPDRCPECGAQPKGAAA